MDKEPPDIFAAARSGSIEQLRESIEAGQSLRETRLSEANMNPVHVAAKHGKEQFVVAAMEIDPSAANDVDGFGCTPFDYSFDRSDEIACDALSKAMPSTDLPFRNLEF